MALVFHVGARGTLGSFFNTILQANKQYLLDNHINLPPDKVSRPLFRNIVNSSSQISFNERDVLNELVPSGHTHHVFLSNQHFWASPEQVLVEDKLYPEAHIKIAALKNVFKASAVTLVIEIESISTFFNRFDNTTILSNLNGLSWFDICEFSWFEIIKKISTEFPEANICVVLGEHAPALLRDILEYVFESSLPPNFQGTYDFLLPKLTRTGKNQLSQLISDQNIYGKKINRNQVFSILKQYGNCLGTQTPAVEMGWESSIQALLRENYLDDVQRLSELDNTVVFGFLDLL